MLRSQLFELIIEMVHLVSKFLVFLMLLCDHHLFLIPIRSILISDFIAC